jgi:hypothetical protein
MSDLMQLPSEHLKLFWSAIGRRSINGGERLLRAAGKHGWICRSAFLCLRSCSQ